MRYGDIYEMFEPIFQWIKEHYPSGGYFIVDHNSAKFYCPHILSVYSKELTNTANSFMNIPKETKEKLDAISDKYTLKDENGNPISDNPFAYMFNQDWLKEMKEVFGKSENEKLKEKSIEE